MLSDSDATAELHNLCMTAGSGIVHSANSRKYCYILSAVSVQRSRENAHLHSISGK